MSAPLAQRMRPQTIDDIVGQRHLLGEGKPLRNIILSGELPNMVFYGPSGVGKTTLASIIAKTTDRHLVKLNGTTASTADIKDVVAKLNTFVAPNGILLYLDEIQYFNKKQQQTLLEYIENGDITLIASTTENPYFYIYNAILSRSTVFEFKFVSAEDVIPAVKRAFDYIGTERHETYDIEDGVFEHIANACGGDVRKAINSVELCVLSSPADESGVCKITLQRAQELTQHSAMRYDREGDEHYDIISAYQKSMRGSDPNAALHYLARLLEAGDLVSACRRLMVCACEDVGLAYPQIIPIVKAAVDAANMLGLPEARIPLADAVVLVATSPKSNSAYNGINAAMADVQKGRTGPVPRQLQNVHCDGEDNPNKGQFYIYPHTYRNHWAPQQYLPDTIKDAVYYEFGDNRTERTAGEYWEKVKKAAQK
ncbi:MAG: replication-associated recombination protein A [Acutalibacteraceae bacterium]